MTTNNASKLIQISLEITHDKKLDTWIRKYDITNSENFKLIWPISEEKLNYCMFNKKNVEFNARYLQSVISTKGHATKY